MATEPQGRSRLEWLDVGSKPGDSGWLEAGQSFRVGDVEFVCSTAGQPSVPGRFTIRKDRALVEAYLDLLDRHRGASILELGLGDGGSVALAALLTQPGRLVGLTLDSARIDALDSLLEKLGLSDRVRLHYGVDQADRMRLAAIVDEEFDGAEAPLDLVIDDASHALDETRSSFETLFPRVRPGGLFLIEDWNHQHLLSLGIAAALASPDQPGLEAFERRLREGPPEAPLSRLVIELVLAQAESGEFVSNVSVDERWLEVRRGPEMLDARGFRLSGLYTDHLGLLTGMAGGR